MTKSVEEWFKIIADGGGHGGDVQLEIKWQTKPAKGAYTAAVGYGAQSIAAPQAVPYNFPQVASQPAPVAYNTGFSTAPQTNAPAPATANGFSNIYSAPAASTVPVPAASNSVAMNAGFSTAPQTNAPATIGGFTTSTVGSSGFSSQVSNSVASSQTIGGFSTGANTSTITYQNPVIASNVSAQAQNTYANLMKPPAETVAVVAPVQTAQIASNTSAIPLAQANPVGIQIQPAVVPAPTNAPVQVQVPVPGQPAQVQVQVPVGGAIPQYQQYQPQPMGGAIPQYQQYQPQPVGFVQPQPGYMPYGQQPYGAPQVFPQSVPQQGQYQFANGGYVMPQSHQSVPHQTSHHTMAQLYQPHTAVQPTGVALMYSGGVVGAPGVTQVATAAPAAISNNAPLPPGWEMKQDASSGRFYYIDHNTKKTQWNRPN